MDRSFVNENKYISSIIHNDMDVMIFNEIKEESAIIQRYANQLEALFIDAKVLLNGTFLLLFKMILEFENEFTLSAENVIFIEVSKMLNFEKLRLRTKGSRSNSYIAFKLLLDSLLEKLRGTELLESIRNHFKDIDYFTEQIDEDFEQMYNQQKLEQLLDEYQIDLIAKLHEVHDYGLKNPSEREKLSDKFLSTLWNLYKDIVMKEKVPVNDKVDKLLEKALDNLDKVSSSSPLSQLFEESLAIKESIQLQGGSQNIDNQENDAKEDETRIESEFEADLKQELEKKFYPYIKSLSMMFSQPHDQSQKSIIKLDDNEEADKNAVKLGDVDETKTPVKVEAFNISKNDEEVLRNIRDFSSSEGGDLSSLESKLHRLASIEEVQYLMDKVNAEIKGLNLSSNFRTISSSIDSFNNNIATLGIKSESIDILSFDEVISLYKKTKDPKFLKFVDKVGRNKSFARKMQYRKRKQKTVPIDRISSSDNIDLIIDDELINLSLDIEAFENDFYDRYLRNDILTIEMVELNDKRKGPIILCYDGSGSMDGIKIEETKAHILAIMEIAKIQKRKMVIIQFASSSEPLYIKEINPLNIKAADVMDIIETFICGGTDFEKPLRKAMEYVKSDRHRRSDILFITDGQCEIGSSFMKEFMDTKSTRKFKLFTIIIHSFTYRDYGDIGRISDEILEIRDKDWNDETNERLFSCI